MKVRYALGKRIIDILISFIGLNLLFPVFVLIAASLKVSSVRRVFFLHKRPGKKGNAFKLIKFKTMNDKKMRMVFYYQIISGLLNLVLF
jgi:undecaprenyl phosphate N,N'-diacetylbacillosamine 1-phosphate transferase